jgi:hypothetical protein
LGDKVAMGQAFFRSTLVLRCHYRASFAP